MFIDNSKIKEKLSDNFEGNYWEVINNLIGSVDFCILTESFENHPSDFTEYCGCHECRSETN